MPTKAAKPPQPEEMLLRVIRVAEILVKSQDQTRGETAVKSLSDQTVVTGTRGEKTQS